ncbi:LON peptidase substrate-binding domain-containing protein [Vibrio metschnikovii]|uniref:LON peptidase substrate-binding domain-containing protein n=1 Tax=Vibrio metschnikovii TaxID=28172 RepID=UPI001C2F4929|nr:LON peptidase substrate-binding domain-containing protein [Vibrio metschnikovii]
MQEIMLFPLSSVVLPEGKMKLRIFEPRYKRMIAECSKANSGFGVCLLDNKSAVKRHQLSYLGTWVKIVDFETLDDGLLGVTVVGVKRFFIEQVRSESDGLRKATVRWLTNWSTTPLSDHHLLLSEQLQLIYQQFPQVGQLYSHRFFDDASWVAQRWLEILPLSKAQWEGLVDHESCHPALSFLTQAIEIYDDCSGQG